MRAACSSATVQEYSEALTAGATFPPIIVFSDGDTYWLSDGFHRFEAHQSAGLTEINAEIRVEERTFTTKYGTEAKRRIPSRPSSGGMVERVLRGLPDDVLMAEVRRRRLVEGLGDE